MTASQMLSDLMGLLPDYDFSNTVDRVIVGDGDRPIRKALVTWMINTPALEHALRHGFDAIITHEPTLWIHRHELDNIDKLGPRQRESAQERLQRIADAGLVVIRNHDVWDHLPDHGIPWAWARFLGLGSRPVRTGEQGCLHRYDIAPTTLGQLAASIAGRTAAIGEDHVIAYGQPDRPVARVGLGTGCICSVEGFLDMGCDVSVLCDDAAWYWQTISWAVDIGHPVIVVGHGTSEHPGMASMVKFLRNRYPDILFSLFTHDLHKHYISPRRA